VATVVCAAALIDLAAGWSSCSTAPRREDVAILTARAAALDLDRPYAAADYKFLDTAIGSASIVQLGESLHLTDEFPRARLRVIQYLHEQLGFDTLALEGSLTQSWLAQEHLDRSTAPQRIARAQELAWFVLWQTAAMRKVMAYVDATRSTPRPLYLTSFDVQVGMSAAYQGEPRIVNDLLDALRVYGPPPDPAREPALRRGLSAIIRCSGLATGANREAAQRAVDELAAWITAIAPRVEPTAHAAALGMIPDNLRDNIELCVRTAGAREMWQETRDVLNARTALKLRDRLSSTRRVILWAHHSHVVHNATGAHVPSMGQHLRDQLGREVYTVGTFAGAGRVFDGALFGERDLPSIVQVGVERMLGAVDRPAYFVDVSRLPTDDPSAGWLVEQRSRFETVSRRPTILAKDFDGAIYLARVHPGAFSDAVAVRWLLRIWGFIIEHALGLAIVIVASLVAGIRAIGCWLLWHRRGRAVA
jgi:erythromycin esterase